MEGLRLGVGSIASARMRIREGARLNEMEAWNFDNMSPPNKGTGHWDMNRNV